MRSEMTRPTVRVGRDRPFTLTAVSGEFASQRWRRHEEGLARGAEL
jgi:hypothetical protein